MKRIFVIGAIAIALTAALIIIGYSKYYRGIKMTRHIPKDTLIDFTFDYPAGWEVFERRGSYGSFIQAQIVEPGITDKEDKPCSIIFTIFPKPKVDFTPISAQGLADDIKQKRLLLKGSSLLSTSTSKFKELKAISQIFSYSIFKVPLQAGAQPVPIKEKVVCFEKGGNLYSLRLENKAEGFERYEKIFDKAVNSIEFR